MLTWLPCPAPPTGFKTFAGLAPISPLSLFTPCSIRLKLTPGFPQPGDSGAARATSRGTSSQVYSTVYHLIQLPHPQGPFTTCSPGSPALSRLGTHPQGLFTTRSPRPGTPPLCSFEAGPGSITPGAPDSCGPSPRTLYYSLTWLPCPVPPRDPSPRALYYSLTWLPPCPVPPRDENLCVIAPLSLFSPSSPLLYPSDSGAGRATSRATSNKVYSTVYH